MNNNKKMFSVIIGSWTEVLSGKGSAVPISSSYQQFKCILCLLLKSENVKIVWKKRRINVSVARCGKREVIKRNTFMNEFGEFLFKTPNKMTNEWIDYAENVHVRTPFKYPSNNNSLITNNNSFLTTNMHHQPPQQFYNKMGIKPFNNNLNNNNSNALNQYSLMNKFQKPSRGELQPETTTEKLPRQPNESHKVLVNFTQKTAKVSFH